MKALTLLTLGFFATSGVLLSASAASQGDTTAPDYTGPGASQTAKKPAANKGSSANKSAPQAQSPASTPESGKKEEKEAPAKKEEKETPAENKSKDGEEASMSKCENEYTIAIRVLKGLGIPPEEYMPCLEEAKALCKSGEIPDYSCLRKHKGH